jgi:hypothetical protein
MECGEYRTMILFLSMSFFFGLLELEKYYLLCPETLDLAANKC